MTTRRSTARRQAHHPTGPEPLWRCRLGPHQAGAAQGCRADLQGWMPQRSATVTLKEEEPVSGRLHAAHSPGRRAHGLHLARQAWLRGKQNPRSTLEARHREALQAAGEPPGPQLHAAPGVRIRWDAAPRQPHMAGGGPGVRDAAAEAGPQDTDGPRSGWAGQYRMQGAERRDPAPGLPLRGQRLKHCPAGMPRGHVPEPPGHPQLPRGFWSDRTERRANHHTEAEGSLRHHGS